jgi:hypothetical protein
MSKCFEVLLSTRVTVLVELGDDGTPADAVAEAAGRLLGNGDGWDWEADDTTELTDADSLHRARVLADIIVPKS